MFFVFQQQNDKLFDISLVRRKVYRGSLATEATYKVKLKNIPDGEKIKNLLEIFEALFDKLLQKVTSNFGPRAKLLILISSQYLDNSIVCPLQKITNYSGKYVIAHLESVLQSKQEIPFDSTFHVTTGVILYPQIHLAGKVPLIEISSKNNFSLLRKKSLFFTPIKSDNQCLLRSICFAINYQKFGNKWDTKVRQKPSYLDEETIKMAKERGLDLSKTYYFHDVEKLEHVFETMISMCTYQNNKFSFVYQGNVAYSKFRIFLFLTPPTKDSTVHVTVIRNITRFFGNEKAICQKCSTIHNKKGTHRCLNQQIVSSYCNKCQTVNCPDREKHQKELFISCFLCGYSFFGLTCYLSHLNLKDKQQKTVCEKNFFCHKCLSSLTDEGGLSLSSHQCLLVFCKQCNKFKERLHEDCFLRSRKAPKEIIKRVCAFDFESVTSESQSCAAPKLDGPPRHNGNPSCSNCFDKECFVYEHKAIYCVMNFTCEECYNEQFKEEEITFCSSCGIRCPKCDKRNRKGESYIGSPCYKIFDSDENTCGSRVVFFGGEFCAYKVVKELTSTVRTNYLIAGHYASAYDFLIILYQYANNFTNFHPQQILFQSGRIIGFNITKMKQRFIDSYSFFSMKLSKLPQTFLFDENKYGKLTHKQFFPYSYLSSNNWNLKEKCKWPEKKYYPVKKMSLKERLEFDIWYESVRFKDFCMFEQLQKYTMSDVYLLISSLFEFRNLILEVSAGPEIKQGFDAFSCLTLGGVAFNIFLTKFLPEKFEVILQDDTDLEQIAVEGVKRGEFLQITLPNGNQIDSENIHQHGYKIIESTFKSSPIGIVPRSLHKTRKNNYSKKAMQFLYFMEKNLQHQYNDFSIRIEHALYKGEKGCLIKQFNNFYYLDGYCKIQGKEMAFQFHGCRLILIIFSNFH